MITVFHFLCEKQKYLKQKKVKLFTYVAPANRAFSSLYFCLSARWAAALSLKFIAKSVSFSCEKSEISYFQGNPPSTTLLRLLCEDNVPLPLFYAKK
jgi:hypothetical protein